MRKDQYEFIKTELLIGKDENILFLTANVVTSQVEKVFIVSEVFVPVDGILLREPDKISYNSNACIDALSFCEDNNSSLISVHSHRTKNLEFSDMDDKADLRLFSNAMLFSNGCEHFSVIMSNTGDLKARRICNEIDLFEDVPIIVIGEEFNAFLPYVESEIDPMQVRAVEIFGEEGQKRLKDIIVGIAGAGGNGSAVFEQLVRLGVGKIVIVDFDKLEEKNISRVYGSLKEDVGKTKVSILKEHAEKINSDIIVYPVDSKVELQDSISHLKGCDLIFGALDGAPYARATLDELKNKYYIPYIDLAMKVQLDSERDIEDIMGRVTLLLPGNLCVMCTKIVRDAQFKAGPANQHNPYVQGVTQTVDPSVISYNTTVSSLAINLFIQYIQGFGVIKRDLRISFLDFERYNMEVDDECDYCLLDLGEADQ